MTNYYLLTQSSSYSMHHSKRPWHNGFSFRWHCSTINAQGARPHIARCDGIQGRDVLETLGPLHQLIHDDSLLRKPLHLLGCEWLAGACSGHRIAIDRAVGQVWRRDGEGTRGSVALTRLSDFATLRNKIVRNLKIFMEIDHLRSPGVLCQL